MKRLLAPALCLVACGCGSGSDAGPDATGVFDAAMTLVDIGGDTGVIVPPDLTPNPCAAKTGQAGSFDRMLMSSNTARRYLLDVPASYHGDSPTELVLAFHGVTNSPEDVRMISHLDLLGQSRGFIAAFPEGIGESWNAGVCCGQAQFTGVDDVQLTRDLIATLSADYCVDPKRIYATGFSNGAIFVYRLACELSGQIAAIGSVAGTIGVSNCAPQRPVPVLEIHGTNDPLVPYDGNVLLGLPSVATTMSGWVMRDGCTGPTTQISQDGNVTCQGYGVCLGGSDVELCTVDGGVHDWTGGGSLWSDAGQPPSGFIASTAILDFFAAHPLP